MMNLGYRLLYGLVWMASRLPLPVLYLKSDILFFLNYYVIRYRKPLVLKNLKNAFPGKSPREIRSIARSFFRYLTDYIVESLYLLGMKEEEARKRLRFKNLFLLEELYRQGRSIILVFPHYANWEWLACLENASPYHVLAVYKPIRNRPVNQLFITLRQKFGLEVVPMKKTLRRMLEASREGQKTITFFLYDQRPLGNELNHWVYFLNQDTPVLLGAEKIARKTNQVVVFLKTSRIKRGYYESEFMQLSDNISSQPKYAITERFWKLLERMIHEEPQYWLWSHNRWKFKRPFRS